MEPVTHFLTGACLARTGFNRKTAYAVLAIVAPPCRLAVHRVPRVFSGIVGAQGHVYVLWPNEYAKEDVDDVAGSDKLAKDSHYTNVSVLKQPAAQLSVPEQVDMVFTSQNYHDYPDAFMGKVDPVAFDKQVYAALKGKSNKFDVYRRKETPPAWHFSENPRIGDLVVFVKEAISIAVGPPRERPEGRGPARPNSSEARTASILVSLKPCRRSFTRQGQTCGRASS